MTAPASTEVPSWVSSSASLSPQRRAALSARVRRWRSWRRSIAVMAGAMALGLAWPAALAFGFFVWLELDGRTQAYAPAGKPSGEARSVAAASSGRRPTALNAFCSGCTANGRL